MTACKYYSYPNRNDARHASLLLAEHTEQRSVIAALRELVAVITTGPVPTTGRDSLVWRTNGESVAVTARQGDLINQIWQDNQ